VTSLADHSHCPDYTSPALGYLLYDSIIALSGNYIQCSWLV